LQLTKPISFDYRSLDYTSLIWLLPPLEHPCIELPIEQAEAKEDLF